MIHRWKYGFKMIQDSGVEYDYVIITRFDLFFNPEITITIKEDLHLYTDSLGSAWSHLDKGMMGDSFMVTSYHKMAEFMDKLTISKWIKGPESDWHTWFYTFSKSVFSKIHNLRLHYTICRYFSKINDSYEQIVQHHCDWRDIQLIEFLISFKGDKDSITWWSPEVIENAMTKWNGGYYTKYNEPNIIAHLNGFSNSTVLLVKEYPNGKLFVRKQGDIIRNYEKLSLLSISNFTVPKIYNKTNDILDMEYIHGIDMKTFLLRHPISSLTSFIADTISKFIDTSSTKDYSTTYIEQLSNIDYSCLPFTMNDLYEKLPKILPQSLCHGDLTLENLIYSTDGKFYMIDAVTGPYDSWVFDIAKLRQDIDGHWFIRNEKIDLSVQLRILHEQLSLKFPEAFLDSLYILMLLRVYRHCQINTPEHLLITEEIKRLWN
jgi:tRNA A-37 threonylcarbamoyl transferase component Bud32